jgi:hypothetical protein
MRALSIFRYFPVKVFALFNPEALWANSIISINYTNYTDDYISYYFTSQC